jgi:hypothetical protein
MKQRLGIAARLLKDPELLILDEPPNGLDPAGIVEVREADAAARDRGPTVFVSSHILNEVQQTADRVAILAKGTTVATGPGHEVLTAGTWPALVRLDDVPRVSGSGRGRDRATRTTAVIRVGLPPAEAAACHADARRPRLYLTELRADEADLETVFLELTSGASTEVRDDRVLAPSSARSGRGLVSRSAVLELLGDPRRHGVIVFLTQEYALVGPRRAAGTSLVLSSVGWMLGASAIGADWHAGHVTTILTWEPRRGRVLSRRSRRAASVFVLSLWCRRSLGDRARERAAGAGSTAGADARGCGVGRGRAPRSRAVDDLRGVRVRAGVRRPQHRGRARGGVRLPRDRREPRARARPQWTPWL